MSEKKRSLENSHHNSNFALWWYALILAALVWSYSSGGQWSTSVVVLLLALSFSIESVLRKVFPDPLPVMMISSKKYEQYVEDAKRQMRESLGSKITLSQKGNVSTIFSQALPTKKTSKLDLNKFVGIIDFDEKNATVTVGGKTPFKMLTEFLIPRGLCPQVVPELDTITVGGAISGVGIESSSFRHGFVHNSMIEIHVLMGDGRVIKASEQENQDLFRGFAHSYATLGYILSAKLRLMKCTRDVRIVAKRMSLRETMKCIQEEVKGDRADFIEGIVFDKNDALVLTATFTKTSFSASNRVELPRDGRFKDILESRTQKNNSTSFVMSTYDYLWRWDADMFWGTDDLPGLGSSTLRTILGRRVLRATVLWWLGQKVRRISSFFSHLFKKTIERERVIQDLGLPFPNAVHFIEQVIENNHAQLPFWLCPARFEGIHEAATLWPPPRGQPKSGGWMLDIASFGSVPRHKSSEDKYYHNRALDKLLDQLGGGKTFYSDVLYTRDFIHEHFNGDEYEKLKRKYDPHSRFPMLCDKVINKDA